MPDRMEYLDLTKEAISDVAHIASDIDTIIKKGDEQADTRKGAIQTIDAMCDALQLACDLISKELSTSIIEFNRVKVDREETLRRYFERIATKFSEPSLRRLLHKGKVCGALHALGDRFRQPFANVTTGGVSFVENVKTFFTRSTRMSCALDGLYEGETNYLYDFSDFLDDIRNRAEAALGGGWGYVDQLRQSGDDLVELMRQKRQILQDQIREIRDAADDCVAKLH